MYPLYRGTVLNEKMGVKSISLWFVVSEKLNLTSWLHNNVYSQNCKVIPCSSKDLPAQCQQQKN